MGNVRITFGAAGACNAFVKDLFELRFGACGMFVRKVY